MMDRAELGMVAGVAFLASVVLTIRLRAYAVAKGMMDRPNERSSHVVVTPRGGGAAIVVATLGCIAYLWLDGELPGRIAAALFGAGGLVAAVGWLDDRGGLSARVRFIAHLAASTAAVAAIGPIQHLPFGAARIDLGMAGFPLSVLGVAWLINLTNFMDGIDGIAFTQTAFVLLASYLLAGPEKGALAAGVAAAAAACGFGVLNWPPAKIFMGDVGSGFLGFVTGASILTGAGSGMESGLWPFVILSSAFIADSTITLLRRAATGQRWSQPHRSHAYQHAARRWGHRAVTLVLLCLNVCWALPMAVLAASNPRLAFLLTLVCTLPLAAMVVRLGGGVADGPLERRMREDEK